ncbi:MAG TPA: hypothetical protein VF066_10205 [Thermoleophilaceae bacterium]
MRAAIYAVAALAAFAPAADASGGRAVMTCASQSSTYFPGAFRDSANVVIGPLAWLFARDQADTDGAYGDGFRWKHPVLVRPGHTVAMRMGAAAKDFAGFAYDHAGGSAFGESERTVVFKACSRSKAASRTDGKPVTFWSGAIVATRGSICLPVEIRVDRGPVRRRTIALNADC